MTRVMLCDCDQFLGISWEKLQILHLDCAIVFNCMFLTFCKRKDFSCLAYYFRVFPLLPSQAEGDNITKRRVSRPRCLGETTCRHGDLHAMHSQNMVDSLAQGWCLPGPKCPDAVVEVKPELSSWRCSHTMVVVTMVRMM